MRLPDTLRRQADNALAAVLSVITVFEHHAAPRPELLLDLIAPIAVALRRRNTLLMAAIVGASNVASVLFIPQTSQQHDALAPIVALLVALYSLGAYVRDLRLSIAAAAFAGGTIFTYLLVPHPSNQFWPFEIFITAGAWSAGWILNRRSRELEEKHELHAEEAVAEERLRLARELHDVIAHGVSVMVVQAQAAASVLDNDPGAARQSLASIERTGRQVVVELRRLLGILRDKHGVPPLVAQPALERVDELIEPLQRAGIHVDLAVEGTREVLPVSLEVSAYRILQEGITNVLKHARAGRVSVVLRYRPESLDLEVLDDGSPAPVGKPTGHGLLGIRERVQLFGGSIEAGPVRDGGYRLWARLPTDGASR